MLARKQKWSARHTIGSSVSSSPPSVVYYFSAYSQDFILHVFSSLIRKLLNLNWTKEKLESSKRKVNYPPNGYINFIYKNAHRRNIVLIYRSLYWSLYRIHTRIHVFILLYILTFFIPFFIIYIYFFWKRRKKKIYIRMGGRVAEWQAWQSKNKYLYTKENLEIQ